MVFAPNLQPPCSHRRGIRQHVPPRHRLRTGNGPAAGAGVAGRRRGGRHPLDEGRGGGHAASRGGQQPRSGKAVLQSGATWSVWQGMSRKPSDLLRRRRAAPIPPPSPLPLPTDLSRCEPLPGLVQVPNQMCASARIYSPGFIDLPGSSAQPAPSNLQVSTSNLNQPQVEVVLHLPGVKAADPRGGDGDGLTDLEGQRIGSGSLR